MITKAFNRVSRSFERSWKIWLLAGIAAAIGADAAYHHFGFDRSGPGTQTATFAVPTPTENSAVTLTPAQIAAAGIMVGPVSAKALSEVFRAPGEVRVNEYSMSNLSSRLPATVISRRAKLGDSVRRGQPLATLYSAAMAEAESTFVLATRNYVRMNNLKEYISGQQFDEAEVKMQEARGRLETYGLSTAEITKLAANGLTNRPAGQFDLFAPQSGVVTTDAFRVGEVVESGKTLFEVADLSTVWVEAQVSPELAPQITSDRAHVHIDDRTYTARVIQVRSELSEVTRTAGIRLQLENSSGALKPGAFVDVELFGTPRQLLGVPMASVLRDEDNDWIVYVERGPGRFEPVKVEVIFSVDDESAITGIADGTRVVTAGAFFVKSEADKSSFAEEE